MGKSPLKVRVKTSEETINVKVIKVYSAPRIQYWQTAKREYGCIVKPMKTQSRLSEGLGRVKCPI